MTIDITPLAVTVTAADRSKAYGDPDPAFIYYVTSRFPAAGDTFSGVLSREDGKGVGDNAIRRGALTLGPNYDLSFIEGAQTIAARGITVTAASRTKAYGETVVFAGIEFAAEGLLDGDSITGAAMSSAVRDAAAGAGTYDIVASGAVGDGLENYTLSYVKGTLTVTKGGALVSVTCSSGSGRPASGHLAGKLMAGRRYCRLCRIFAAAGEPLPRRCLQRGCQLHVRRIPGRFSDR